MGDGRWERRTVGQRGVVKRELFESLHPLKVRFPTQTRAFQEPSPVVFAKRPSHHPSSVCIVLGLRRMATHLPIPSLRFCLHCHLFCLLLSCFLHQSAAAKAVCAQVALDRRGCARATLQHPAAPFTRSRQRYQTHLQSCRLSTLDSSVSLSTNGP